MSNLVRPQSQKGQVIAAILGLIALITIIVPLLVYYTLRDESGNLNRPQTINASKLAETGLEKALLAISIATTTWTRVQRGEPVPGFGFDVAYNDNPGGTWTVLISSGPGKDQATIVSIGRDFLKKETRAIQAIYVNASTSGASVVNSTSTLTLTRISREDITQAWPPGLP